MPPSHVNGARPALPFPQIILLALVAALLPGPEAVLAATGKIAGVVQDGGSGAPLPGANVVLLGSGLGATTDSKGRFYILNVPPGSYSVRATYIGYGPYTLEMVRVSADLTTRVELRPEPAHIQVREVVVRAERPIIDKNATNAVRIVTAEDLAVLPVRGVRNVFALQAGVVEAEGRFHIRGSRSDEIGYFVEGADVRNPITGASAVTLIDEAVQEVQIQAGGYNAEYGGANGGIILQQLRTGGSQWHVGLSLESDRFTTKYRKRLGTYSYGRGNQVLSLGGPLLGSGKVRAFAALQRRFRASRAVFWEGFKFADLVDSGHRGGRIHWRAPDAPDAIPLLHMRPGNIDHTGRDAVDLNTTLLFDYTPLKVRLTGLYSIDDLELNPAPVRNMLNRGRLPQAQRSSGLLHARATHLLDPSMYCEVGLSLYRQQRAFFDPIFEEHFMVYNDSVAVARASGEFTPYPALGTPPRAYDLNGFPLARPGTPTSFANGSERATFYSREEDRYIGLSGSFAKQHGEHQFKMGFAAQRWTARRFFVLANSLRTAIHSTYPDLDAAYQRYYDGEIGVDKILDALLEIAAEAPAGKGNLDDLKNLMRQNSQANFYGFDEFGRRRQGQGLEAPRHPILGNAYIQDKIEYQDLVIIAGLRWDYFDVDSFRFVDAAAPVRLAARTTIDLDSMRPTRKFHRFSPRLGLSFQISDRTVFHGQYGRFSQMPRLGDMYTGGAALSLELAGGSFIPVPTAFDVEPVRTTQYEIGFDHQFTRSASFDLTGFYRDVEGQLQVRRQKISPAAVDVEAYNFLDNGDFATTRGLELTFKLRRQRRLRAELNYTLADARGTGSTINSGIAGIENATNLPTIISPLDFNQTHRGSLYLDYRFGTGEGGPLLERLGANLLLRFSSGHNFTLVDGSIGQRGPELGGILASDDPRSRIPLEPINSSTTPWTLQTDLQVDKKLACWGVQMQLYLYIQNLFNRKNAINVYGRTGSAADDGFLSDPELSAAVIEANGGARYEQLYKAINLDNRQHYWFTEGGDIYAEPRQIRLGLRVGI